MTSTVTIEQFEIVKHSTRVVIPPDLWNANIDIQEMVEGYVAIQCSWESASKVAKDVIEVPCDWWQHLKQRFAPWWFIKHWPVIMTTYHARIFCPDVQVPHRGPDRRFGTFEVAHLPTGAMDYRVGAQ